MDLDKMLTQSGTKNLKFCELIYIKCGENTTTKNVSPIAMHGEKSAIKLLYSFASEAFDGALSTLSQCIKSPGIRSFSGPYFPAFGLNMEIYSVNLRISPNAGKYGPEKL